MLWWYDRTVMCLISCITGIHSSLGLWTRNATFMPSALPEQLWWFCFFGNDPPSAGKLLGSAFATDVMSTQLMMEAPGGPHDVFKSATHLSLERALSSKHNGDRGYKQMVYKRCGSSQTDWTELVVSLAIPTVRFHRGDTRGWWDFHMADLKLSLSLSSGLIWQSQYLGILLIIHNVLVISQ